MAGFSTEYEISQITEGRCIQIREMILLYLLYDSRDAIILPGQAAQPKPIY
jgi:hypothetical protein